MAWISSRSFILLCLAFLVLSIDYGFGIDSNTWTCPNSLVYTRNELLEIRESLAAPPPDGCERFPSDIKPRKRGKRGGVREKYINIPMRNDATLDLCYGNIRNAYKQGMSSDRQLRSYEHPTHTGLDYNPCLILCVGEFSLFLFIVNLSPTVKTLSGELDGWLSKADQCSRARAIIAPHAGYSYSGACGAYAYKQVDPTNIERVFILGPSHHVYLPGCALSTCTKYETPLYNLQVDQTVNRELMKTKMFETMSVQVDEDEHSIEMHLPYIAKVMERRRGNFTIVPVLVGALDGKKEQEYGRFFSSYLADPSNLFVVSSDFCHWGEF
nr:protein MEMO1-like [Lytechinus pictus]